MSIREQPPHQVLLLLKDARVTQAMIGRRVGVTQSFVSRVIYRQSPMRPSKTSEKVWRAIERATKGAAA